MQKDVSADEVKRTIFTMKSNKAPGLDGFSTGFYKAAWPIISDVVQSYSILLWNG